MVSRPFMINHQDTKNTKLKLKMNCGPSPKFVFSFLCVLCGFVVRISRAGTDAVKWASNNHVRRA